MWRRKERQGRRSRRTFGGGGRRREEPKARAEVGRHNTIKPQFGGCARGGRRQLALAAGIRKGGVVVVVVVMVMVSFGARIGIW